MRKSYNFTLMVACLNNIYDSNIINITCNVFLSKQGKVEDKNVRKQMFRCFENNQ